MVMFSPEEIARLKRKLKLGGAPLDPLRKQCQERMRGEIHIPTSGIATWGHYFACASDGARLRYDYNCDRDFRCPSCGRIHNGEPYTGAWWRITNTVNTSTALCAALVYTLSGEEEYRDLSRKILLGYADNYPNYEEHGDIPYNKPGRMNSQILCESECLRVLAQAYDLTAPSLTEVEKRHIEDDLLFPGAEILKKNRTPQLHNHEVIVNAGLGVIGLVTGRDDYTDFAVNSPYGLRYQLEHGTLEDGMWFESTLHYHFFALLAFMDYEKVARGTPYSLLGTEGYKRLYALPLKLLTPGYDLPRLGDGGNHSMLKQLADHYEFMYAVYGSEEFAGFLNAAYRRVPRDGLTVFLYGADSIQKAELTLNDYHNDAGSGLTVLRGSDKKQYLLFRHGRYGGEHDHYDKLNLHYAYGEIDVLPDLGTVAYGTPPHYGYFKNTFTHNTVCINAQNQPPCNGRTLRFIKTGDQTLVECRADWSVPNALPDSFVIKQWDEEAYRGVRMERTILFTDEYFLEAFRVRGAKGRQTDWIIHPRGRCEEAPGEKRAYTLTGSEPCRYMKNARGLASLSPVTSRWQNEAGSFYVCSACSVNALALYAEGPGNPMSEELTYLIRRVENAPDDLVFATVFSLNRQGKGVSQANIEINGGEICARFTLDGQTREQRFTVGE
ncbi:MAG: heparinase II/III family protein [Clostridia bacterium]|nr:heparinase II/III family protein [Clostridia bacterium]